MIRFQVGGVGGTDFSAPGLAWIGTFVETSIRLDQIPPKDLLEEALLNLIAHVPREEIVYLLGDTSWRRLPEVDL